MTFSSERLEPRLRETALIVLRRHNIGEDDLQIEMNEPHEPPSRLIRGSGADAAPITPPRERSSPLSRKP